MVVSWRKLTNDRPVGKFRLLVGLSEVEARTRLFFGSTSRYLPAMHDENDEPVEYPIDGTLDLHQFRPNETKDVLLEYIAECLKRDILSIRVVHGKGIGVQREIVRSVLSTHPNVVSFRHEEGSGGGWGATVVDLRK